MQTSDKKRYYSPQFSKLAAVSIRRLAWSMEMSLPKAVDQMVRLLPSIEDPSKVCLSCKNGSKCAACIYGSLGSKQGITAS